MELILLPLIPFLSGLLCLLVQSSDWWERVNLACFALVAGMAAGLGLRVAHGSEVTALDGFLRVDALSALVIGVTAFVAFVSAIYAIGYFRRENADGRITERQMRLYYVLTPLFVCAMLLAPLVDNLGVMWVAIESTTMD